MRDDEMNSTPTNPTPNGNCERVTVLLPRSLYLQICREAEKRLLSRSAVIREALARRFREDERPAQ